MSPRIRIAVRSTRTRSFGWSWVAVDHREDGRTEHIRYGYAPTMPAALAEAHAAALVIHRILMDEVHASRARRRVLAGQALDHDYIGVAGHPDDDECTHRADGTDATYCGEPDRHHALMEATA